MTKNSETVPGFPAGKHWRRAKMMISSPFSVQQIQDCLQHAAGRPSSTSSGDVSRRRKRLEVGDFRFDLSVHGSTFRITGKQGYREFTVLVVNGSIKDDNGRSIISLSLKNYAALLPACLVISGAAIAAGIVMKSPRLSPEFELTCLLALFLQATWCVVAWITYFKLTSKALEQLCSLVRWLEELVQGRVVKVKEQGEL